MSSTQTATSDVPFLDLRLSHDGIKDALLSEIADLIDSNAYTNGPQVAEFESAFAQFCGVESCVGLASGLDALRLSLQALGIQPGDEVILPANTFVATAEAVTQAGGRAVLVDASPDDYNIAPEAVEAAVGPRTRFVVPVHLYGQLADMQALCRISTKRDVALVEDACQAHGAERDGIRAGAEGAAAAFSFYPGKNLGAFGDAGAAVTNSGDIADRMRALREHGQREKYRHDAVGWTARLDTIQALVLLRKLALLDRWNEQRRDAAAAYLELLADTGDLVLPPVASGSIPVWHLFVVRTGNPDGLARFLRDRGVATGRHYPEPIHLTTAYAELGYRRGAFPVSEAIADTCLSLPMFPGITTAQIERVADEIRGFFADGR